MKNDAHQKNPLSEVINIFFDNILSIMFSHQQVKSHLLERKKALEKAEWGGSGSHLTIKDLTGASNQGWPIPYSTGLIKSLNLNEVRMNIPELVRMDGMRSLAHCYEALETLMLDLLAVFISEYPEYSHETGTKVKSEIKQSIRNYYKRKNNKEMLKAFRRISEHFKKHEKMLNLSEWYIVLTEVRHGIIHSFFKVNISKFKSNRKCSEIFNNYFYSESTDNENIKSLKMSHPHISREMSRCAEFGFFLFKSLCIEGGYDWQILKK